MSDKDNVWSVEVVLPTGEWSEWIGYVDRATAETERTIAAAEGWVTRIRRESEVPS